MIVTYEPSQPKSGLTSLLTWNNPDLHAAMKQAFAVSEHERITHLEVTRDGIKAIFETVRKDNPHA